MERNDLEFVDLVRREWLQASSDKTLTQIVKEIPLTIRRLINIIDSLQNEVITLKENL